MKNNILVTYASFHGSTQEIAEAVAETLRSHDLNVDILPIKKVCDLEKYKAVVLGAPLYMFHWHQDAFHFLSKFRNKILTGFPIALFIGGPTETGNEEEWKEVRSQVDRELTKVPWLKPISLQLVGGKLDPARLRFPYNLIPALRQMPAKDLRDFAAIRSWADSLVKQFVQTI